MESPTLKQHCTLGGNKQAAQRECHCQNVESKLLDEIKKGPLPGYDDIVRILHLVDEGLSLLFCRIISQSPIFVL